MVTTWLGLAWSPCGYLSFLKGVGTGLAELCSLLGTFMLDICMILFVFQFSYFPGDSPFAVKFSGLECARVG